MESSSVYETNNKTFTRLTREERETYYQIDEVNDVWICDTSIQKDIRKLERQGWEKIDGCYYPDGTIMWAKFKAPRNCLSPRAYNPDKKKRVMSPEHKAKLLAAKQDALKNK